MRQVVDLADDQRDGDRDAGAQALASEMARRSNPIGILSISDKAAPLLWNC